MIVKVSKDNRTITITMDSDSNSFSSPVYEPQDRYLMYLLEQSYGFYGHSLDPSYTTPLDLYTALLSLDGYEVLEVDKEPLPVLIDDIRVT